MHFVLLSFIVHVDVYNKKALIRYIVIQKDFFKYFIFLYIKETQIKINIKSVSGNMIEIWK